MSGRTGGEEIAERFDPGDSSMMGEEGKGLRTAFVKGVRHVYL